VVSGPTLAGDTVFVATSDELARRRLAEEEEEEKRNRNGEAGPLTQG
jgi:hypothetical protein